MPALKNLTGQRFGRLIVLHRGPNLGRYVRWWCLCDCGAETLVRSSFLRGGITSSCGCLRKDSAARCHTKHGLSQSRLYRIWTGIKQRCTNPKRNRWPLYGERGIGVCEEWLHFPTFAKWALTHGYKKNLTIDREDNDKGYSPNNCRWVPHGAQAANTRKSRFLTHKEKTLAVSEWARELRIDRSTIRRRISRGLPVEKVLSQ